MTWPNHPMPAEPCLRRGRRSDDGQIALLVLCFVTIAASLILVVVAASSVHLERKRLVALADAVALDAADDTSPDIYLREGLIEGEGVALTDESVRASARAFLADSGARGVQVADPTGAPTGRAAVVTLTTTAQPPLVAWVLDGWGDGIVLTVTAKAEAPLR